MNNKSDEFNCATSTASPPECPRCGDLFYHPKTIIESEKQRAAEWEECFLKSEAKNKELVEAIESWKEFRKRTVDEVCLKYATARKQLKEQKDKFDIEKCYFSEDGMFLDPATKAYALNSKRIKELFYKHSFCVFVRGVFVWGYYAGSKESIKE